MNILFLYPKQADSENTRESRLEHQLGCLTRTAWEILSSAGRQRAAVVTALAYDSAAGTIGKLEVDGAINGLSANDTLQLFKQTDLLIEINGETETQAAYYGYDGAAITLGPTYPGSFAQNDINISCTNVDSEQKAWMTEQVIRATREAEKSAKLSEYIEPDMHYSQYSPLPFRLGPAFYKREPLHAMIMLAYSPAEQTESVSDADKQTVAGILHQCEGVKSITLVTETQATASMVKGIAEFIESSFGIEVFIFAHRRGDYRDLFSALAKCDIAFFGGSSLYVDAIRLGKPVSIWRSQQHGIEPLNDAFKKLLQTGPKEVAAAQYESLDRLVESHYYGGTVPNDKRALTNALISVLTQMAPGVELDARDYILDPLIPEAVIDQPRIWHHESVDTKIKHRFSDSRRKLRKFTESPSRFIGDSENPIAKKIASFMR